ncbi:MAG: hypothetical protein VW547_13025 [Alphaproteobacteria bacterium]
MKAPIVTPTGCACCGSGGVLGTACAVCTRHAHGVEVRRHDHALRFGTAAATVRMQCAEDARAAWCGADLLLDVAALAGVGFEVPSLVRLHGPETAP